MSKKRPIDNEENFRNVVRSRDNWTCQRCGSGEYAQAHHIDAVKDYPLFAHLPDNGITLCVYCHADAHPEIPRGLFISKVIQAEQEGCISAGKLAKELKVNPRTVVRKAIKLGILKPMQKWMFTDNEAEIIRKHSQPKEKKVKQKKCKQEFKKILVYLWKDQYQRLLEISYQHDVKMASIIRQALAKYFEVIELEEK